MSGVGRWRRPSWFVAFGVMCGVGALSACAPAAPVAAASRASAVASAHPVALPPAGARFDYQIGGPYPPDPGVMIVDRDRSAPPAPGRYGICYINAFQTQAGEAAFWRGRRAGLLLRDPRGRLVGDPDWPGEHVLDIRTPAKRSAIARIEDAWIDGCARAGFRAVEPDNLDTFTRFGRLLTANEALAMARLLVERAHGDGLAIAQKNTDELGARGRTEAGFDFAIAEECQVYRECDQYTRVYGREVIEVEYTDNGRRAFAAACRDHGATTSIELRDRDVEPRGRAAYRAAWCS